MPLRVPQLLVHGTADTKVPIDQTTGYADHARAAGDEIALRTVEGADHMRLIDPTSGVWQQTLTAVRDALS
ncbi:MAG: S9 family peptidase [Actinobacteria bacterium]|nr:S9 family peptidase [Actinomycetota bacterium]